MQYTNQHSANIQLETQIKQQQQKNTKKWRSFRHFRFASEKLLTNLRMPQNSIWKSMVHLLTCCMCDSFMFFFFNFSLFLYCICCDGVVCVWMNSLVYLKIAGEKVGKTSNNSKINVLHHLYRWFYFCGIFFIYCIKLFIYTIQKVSLLFTSIKANMIHWK